jgi:hypothetical protein
MIVSEYGTELTSNAVLVWYGVIGVEWHYIAPRQSVVIGSSVGLVSLSRLRTSPHRGTRLWLADHTCRIVGPTRALMNGEIPVAVYTNRSAKRRPVLPESSPPTLSKYL